MRKIIPVFLFWCAFFAYSNKVAAQEIAPLKLNSQTAESALRSACCANLKQLGLVLGMYAAENRNTFPPLDDQSEGFIWDSSALYPEYLTDAAIPACPSNPEFDSKTSFRLPGDTSLGDGVTGLLTQPFNSGAVHPDSIGTLSYVYGGYMLMNDPELDISPDEFMGDPNASFPGYLTAAANQPTEQEESLRAFWNTWFTLGTRRKQELMVGRHYVVTLDISRFSYFPEVRASVPVAPEVIQPLLGENPEFIIRPILHGNKLRLVSEQEETLTVEIGKLLPSRDDDTTERSLEKKMLASAGKVEFEVEAVSDGDATIFFTIWAGTIPLDYLTLSVSVTSPWSQDEKLDPARKTFPTLRTGSKRTLLEVSHDFSSTADPFVADAAFHIFEPLGRQSIILFAARNPEASAAVPGIEEKVDVYAWETPSLLSDYFLGNRFLSLIETARGNATDYTPKGYSVSYAGVAKDLGEELFAGRGQHDKQQAKLALAAFKQVAEKENSVVFVRMSNQNGQPVYPPLGILAAKGPDEEHILKNRIILVEPLQWERYPGGVLPGSEWRLGLPEELMGDQYNEVLKKITTSARRIADFAGLKTFLGTKEEKPKPEGILILAHQRGGYLYPGVKNDTECIKVQNIDHVFASGSIAILSACSTAKADKNNQAIVNKLNEMGIDAMVVSPLPVMFDFGRDLAIQFVQALQEATEPLSLAELFKNAEKKTYQQAYDQLGNATSVYSNDRALEFVIAGDYRIQVAPISK